MWRFLRMWSSNALPAQPFKVHGAPFVTKVIGPVENKKNHGTPWIPTSCYIWNTHKLCLKNTSYRKCLRRGSRRPLNGVQRRSHGDSIWGMFFIVLETSGAGCLESSGLFWNAVTSLDSHPWFGKSPAWKLERSRWHGGVMELDCWNLCEFLIMQKSEFQECCYFHWWEHDFWDCEKMDFQEFVPFHWWEH